MPSKINNNLRKEVEDYYLSTGATYLELSHKFNVPTQDIKYLLEKVFKRQFKKSRTGNVLKTFILDMLDQEQGMNLQYYIDLTKAKIKSLQLEGCTV